MRVVGIDPGSRRVGIAIGHTGTGVATPYEVWQRRDATPLTDRVRALVQEWEAACVVVGLPRSLDGSVGPAARAAEELAAELDEALEVPVELHDERFSTVTAQEALHRGGIDTRRGRKVVDAVAASVILQSWLDARGRSVG